MMDHLTHWLAKYLTMPRLSAGALLAAGWSWVAAIQFPELSELNKLGLPSLVVVVCLFGMYLSARAREREMVSNQAAMANMMKDYATSVAVKDNVLDQRHQETVAMVKDVLAALSAQAASNTKLAEAVSMMATATNELRVEHHGRWHHEGAK